MSDSDSDLLTNDVLTFQSQGTTISARGPILTNTNISSLSFRNNVLTSTMNMPWKMDRPRYAESVCDQRSMYYRRERETSPMSLHSASGMRTQNLHHSYYPSNSHKSMYNGRCGSPMSVRTIDSNMSMSAKDIVFAFENGTFNKFDFRIIKDAYNKYIKRRTRKRVEKRRNARMFLKRFRRRSGEDTGDQASNSSISSDDSASIKTSNLTVYRSKMSSCRSTKTDISDFRRTMRDSNVIRDCTENVRQNSLKTILSQGLSTDKEIWQKSHPKWQNESTTAREVNPQNDRLKNSYLLPSQRFSQPLSSLTTYERPNRLQKIKEGNTLNIKECHHNLIDRPANHSQDIESEQEEIFANITVMDNNCGNNKGKRSREEDDIHETDKKRSKLSPIKNKPKSPKKNNQSNTSFKQSCNDFVFAKPQLPIMKQPISKQQKLKPQQKKEENPPPQEKQLTTENITPESPEKPIEKIISSSQKVVEKLISKSVEPLEKNEAPLPTDTTQHSNTDVSMRPSFIKRKLFTQKVDVAEKNSSSDSLQTDSPQTNLYSKIQKEKNKARKVVATQSLLNRDVQDDSNLLDLIHKIVPADRMNITTAINRTEIPNNKSKPNDTEKWDVTSVITVCNNSDDISDTFTDEDVIFGEDNEKQNLNKNKKQNTETVEKAKNELVEVKKQTITVQKNKPMTKTSNEQMNKPMMKTINEQNSMLINKAKLNSDEQTDLNKEKTKGMCKTNSKLQIQKTIKQTDCRIIVEKLHVNSKERITARNIPQSPTEKMDLMIYKGVKSFWDTDAESDLETTPFKRNGSKYTETPQPKAANIVPPRYNAPSNQVLKQSNTSSLSCNKTKDSGKTKTTVNQTINSCLKSKQKESKLDTQSKKGTINNQTIDKVVVENELCKTNKTIPAAQKENTPPIKDSNKPARNNTKVSKTSVETKKNNKVSPEKRKGRKKTTEKTQNTVESITKDKNKTQINNQTLNNDDFIKHIKLHKNTQSTISDVTTTNKESQEHIKVNNNKTLRIRTQRNRKVHRCCDTPDSSDLSNLNNTTLSRTLRSRVVEVKSDGNKIKKTLKAGNVSRCSGEFVSDVSFTLTTEPTVNRTMRTGKALASSKKRETRQSDVSFTLSEEKSLNTSVLSRGSKRNKQLESLQDNLGSFFKTGKRTPTRTIALKSRALNRSNSTRLTKSRQLI